MVDRYISRQKEKEGGYSIRQCLHMFGVSKSGYYSWKNRQKDVENANTRRQKEYHELAGKFKAIIVKLGYVPGKRTFRNHLWRDYGLKVSVKRCRRIMEKMSLVPNRPKKDAYKHQAAHDHEAAAPANKVKQNFYQAPRKVILTDITYLYYGPSRTPIYLCVFKDAYTKEILGASVDTQMTVDLVKTAYDRMKQKHGNELSKAVPYIHSDQGSQYLSTAFKEMLENDSFVQSVSARGNSQDNAPMESFFGRLKTRILDLVALCPDTLTARRMILGYIDSYNTKMYQYNLAGLTPNEFYLYCTTGIYPLDNYYGVEATELRTVSDLVKDRLQKAREKAEKIRIANARKREERSVDGKSPLQILARDQRILKREIKNWQTQDDTARQQLTFLKSVYEKTKQAGQFFISLAKEEREKFCDISIWKEYEELDYVFDMKGMF